MSNKLIISPHIDDEILGPGGILDQYTHVVYCGYDESHIPNRPTSAERLREAEQVSNYLGHSFQLLDNQINNYSVSKLIGDIETVINEIQPDEIYIPNPSYNQDHKAVYDAAMVATRPHDNNWFVKKILLYEQPQVILWNNTGREFRPSYYVPIDIERKLSAYKLMGSQLRSFRSPELLKSIAHLRGQQSNYEYAEAYEILRWIK